MEKVCIICGERYECLRPSMNKGNCSKNSCRSKRYYYENHDKQKERVRKNYHKYKLTHYERIRATNIKAQEKKRFNVPRQVILERDDYCCQNCGAKDNLVIHHKDNNGRRQRQPNND